MCCDIKTMLSDKSLTHMVWGDMYVIYILIILTQKHVQNSLHVWQLSLQGELFIWNATILSSRAFSPLFYVNQRHTVDLKCVVAFMLRVLEVHIVILAVFSLFFNNDFYPKMSVSQQRKCPRIVKCKVMPT